MKAEQIRKIEIGGSYGKDDTLPVLLREIAAQLADLNESIRHLASIVVSR